MRTQWLLAFCFLLASAPACGVTLHEEIPASVLDTTERSAFTSDGRLFVIGSRPDAGAWLFELVRGSDGKLSANNFLAGALEGTSDGRLGSAAAGDACIFSGMKAQGMRIYAACAEPSNYRIALLAIDLEQGSVRAGYFTSCNAAPSGAANAPCEYSRLYANGMALDAAGRIYVSNMVTHLQIFNDTPTISEEGDGSIRQILIDEAASSGRSLVFTHRPWFSADILTDGLSPNGIQIEGDVLYYAAGANINRVDITPQGEAGASSVHYQGPDLSYIDDFAVLDGRMALARTLPPAVVALDRAEQFGTAKELGTLDMDLDAIPSSITYQADVPAGRPLFAAGSVIVTCFFGGGIYSIAGTQ